eukprot:gene13075-8921_t
MLVVGFGFCGQDRVCMQLPAIYVFKRIDQHYLEGFIFVGWCYDFLFVAEVVVWWHVCKKRGFLCVGAWVSVMMVIMYYLPEGVWVAAGLMTKYGWCFNLWFGLAASHMVVPMHIVFYSCRVVLVHKYLVFADYFCGLRSSIRSLFVSYVACVAFMRYLYVLRWDAVYKITIG